MNRKVLDRNPLQGELEGRSSLLRGTPLLLLLVGIILLLNALLFQRLFFSSQGIPGFRNQCSQVEELEGKLKNVKADNQKLFRRIQAFKNSPRAQEKMVREELGWLRDNELLIQFKPKDAPPAP